MKHLLAHSLGFALSLVFVLAVFLVPAAAVDCDPEPTDMTINYSSPVIQCSIDPVADIDLFRFDAEAGDLVRIGLSESPSV